MKKAFLMSGLFLAVVAQASGGGKEGTDKQSRTGGAEGTFIARGGESNISTGGESNLSSDSESNITNGGSTN
mgnify:CR=1 FL=1